MISQPPDPYKILGVSKDAQTSEIRSAHRRLVLKCHPDKVQDPALKAEKQDEFQKVQQAYELLSDDRERQKYDDQIKLAELRKQFQAQANISTPRSSPKEFNIYTAEPSGPMGRSPLPVSKVYTYSRSWEDEIGRGPRIFDTGTPRPSRREASFPERPTKRELERERERERDAKDRDKERDRRRKVEDARRAEKEAKEARRYDKNKRDKQRDKDIRREADEKRRYAKPYIEPFDDEPQPPKAEKKKSSSGKKYDEKRDRSSGREEDVPHVAPPPPGPQRSYTSAMDFAQSYIEASRAKKGATLGLQRSKTYHPRNVQPPAPTPPPMTASSSPFPAPDDDVRRSSARPRHGPGEGPRLARERPYGAASREPTDEPLVMNVSPTSRHTAQFSKSTSATPHVPSSPPRREIPRTNSLPVDAAYPARPVPGIARAQTFDVHAEGAMRGRARSRMHAQIDEESDTEDMWDRRTRDREAKHRGGRRPRSPEPENVSRYHVDGGRAKLQSTYSRRLEAELEQPRYYSTSAGIPVVESRPPGLGRESSYTGPGMKFPRIKTSKAYGYNDVKYSNYQEKPYREGYTAYA